jgi:hypothetical protein
MGQAEMRETPKLKTGDDDANKNAQKIKLGNDEEERDEFFIRLKRYQVRNYSVPRLPSPEIWGSV